MEECSEDQGMPLVYKPFQTSIAGDPEMLPVLIEEAVPAGEETRLIDTAEEVIMEQDGIPYVNNQAIIPGRKTAKTLDQKFLTLVDSLIKPADPGGP
jgi:hypothetical protein